MNLIEKAVSNLKPSRPVFKVRVKQSYGGGHDLRLDNVTSPDFGKGETPIDKLVADNFVEDWKEDRYIVSEEAIVKSCKTRIKGHIVKFLERNMTQKHPMETKLGMFYRDRAFTVELPEFDSALISTWNFFAEKNDVQNTMRLLEYLFIKHKDSFPEEPKRTDRQRRRRRRR